MKEKRKIIHRILARVRNRYKASLAEVDQQDQWQFSTIVVALVNTNSLQLEQALYNITCLIDEECEIIEIERQLIQT